MPEEQIISPQWLHLKGNTETGSDIGYYFPENRMFTSWAVPEPEAITRSKAI